MLKNTIDFKVNLNGKFVGIVVIAEDLESEAQIIEQLKQSKFESVKN